MSPAMPFLHVAIGASGSSALDWGWEWAALPFLVLAVACYGRGLLRMRKGPSWQPARVACVCAGVALALTAVVGPLDDAASRSFAAHMTQHMLLMLVAAPLLVFGLQLPALLAGLPRDLRRGAVRARRNHVMRRVSLVMRSPATTFGLYAGVLAFWHIPDLYDAAVRHNLLHGLEHASLFTVAALSWSTMLGHSKRGAAGGLVLLYVFGLMLECTALAGLFTLADRPLYGVYSTGHPLGLAPLQDQQLGGVVMGTIAAIVYLGSGAALLLRWLASDEGQASPATRLAPSPAAMHSGRPPQ